MTEFELRAGSWSSGPRVRLLDGRQYHLKVPRPIVTSIPGNRSVAVGFSVDGLEPRDARTFMDKYFELLKAFSEAKSKEDRIIGLVSLAVISLEYQYRFTRDEMAELTLAKPNETWPLWNKLLACLVTDVVNGWTSIDANLAAA